MGSWRHITFRDGLAVVARASGLIAAAALAAAITGCASLCTFGRAAPEAANAPAVASNSHRPPTPFPDGSAQEPEPAPPQMVNVFGEVNGAVTKNIALSSDGAFQQHTFPDEGYDSDVAVDPSGKWLTFSSTRNSEHPSIYLQRVDGTAVTQLTSGGCDDAHPVFSPDGTKIAFSSTRAGNWQIYMMDRDGRNSVQITSGPAQAIHPSFSPDGNRLVYCGLGGRSGQWELWTIDLKTGERRMIGYGLFPSWSPSRSGDRIAFQRARQRGSRWFSLWTIDLIDGEGRNPTEIAISANAAILAPAWSGDGKRLAFATVLQPGKGGERPRGQTDIWMIDADGSNRRRLTDGRGNNLMPFWSADNRVFFISDRAGGESIWSVRTDPARPPALEAAVPSKEKTAVGSVNPTEDVTK